MYNCFLVKAVTSGIIPISILPSTGLSCAPSFIICSKPALDIGLIGAFAASIESNSCLALLYAICSLLPSCKAFPFLVPAAAVTRYILQPVFRLVLPIPDQDKM